MNASSLSPADESRSPANSSSYGSASGEVSSKEELEREQLRLTNEKLRIETSKLQRDAKPERWWSKAFKSTIAFGGVVTVAATAYGIWDSYDKTIVDRERSRLVEQRTRFEDAIKHLESSSTISKLVGVSVLSGYLNAANKQAHRQVLFTLAGLIATEKDPQTQIAVIDLLTSIPKDGPIALADWRYFQDILVTQSRALVAKGDLVLHRQHQSASPVTDDERAARAVGKLIASNARKGVVADYSNYRGIFCAECDFHGVIFPHSTDFTGAILDRSNFSGARLEAAVFDNAELAGTRFVESDLQQAKFRSLNLTNAGDGDGWASLTSYIDHIASALDLNPYVDIIMPNFSCANLAEANFDNHSLFPGVNRLMRAYTKEDQDRPGWYQNVSPYIKDQLRSRPTIDFPIARIEPPKFFKANITGAHFERVRFFSLNENNSDPDYYSRWARVRIGEIQVRHGYMDDRAFVPNQEGSDLPLSVFQRRLKAAFQLVELDRAHLPGGIANFLKTPLPDGSESGVDCAPRRN